MQSNYYEAENFCDTSPYQILGFLLSTKTSQTCK